MLPWWPRLLGANTTKLTAALPAGSSSLLCSSSPLRDCLFFLGKAQNGSRQLFATDQKCFWGCQNKISLLFLRLVLGLLWELISVWWSRLGPAWANGGGLWLLRGDSCNSEGRLKMPNHVNLLCGIDTCADLNTKTALKLWWSVWEGRGEVVEVYIQKNIHKGAWVHQHSGVLAFQQISGFICGWGEYRRLQCSPEDK